MEEPQDGVMTKQRGFLEAGRGDTGAEAWDWDWSL